MKYQLKQIDPLMTIDCEDYYAWLDNDNYDDESDIDEAFSKLTGVQHTRPKIVLQYTKYVKQSEGFYDSLTDYGQNEYDPDNDPFVQDMTTQERKEHYRILGVSDPYDNTPELLKRYL